MTYLRVCAMLVTCALPLAEVAAYQLELGTQVLAAQDPNIVYVELGETDGATDKNYDSGVVVSGYDPASWGRFDAGVDFATGMLRAKGEAFGNYGMAGGHVGFADIITFHLPDGMTSTKVGFALTVDGSYSSAPEGQGYYVSGYAGISLGYANAGNGGDSDAATFMNKTFSGEIVVNEGNNSTSINALIIPYVDGIFGRGADVYGYYDLVGRVTLQLEPGVTISSQSGKLLIDASPLASFTLASTTVAGCKSVSGTITLSQPAPATGTVVAISDSLSAVTAPATVTIAPGATSKKFSLRTTPVSVSEPGTVSASLMGNTLTRNLTVRPMGLQSVGLTPTSVVGSQPVTGKATLECNAGPGPITVDLSSNNVAVASPVAASIVVPQGVKTANFDVTTNAVQARSYATVFGTANGITKSKKLTVNVAAAVSPTSLKFGTVTVGTTSAPQNAILTNKGAVPFSINSVSLTGTAAPWFAQTNTCPATLNAGASCTISVTFSPQAALSKSVKLAIATSATSTPLGVSLSGTGI